MRYGPAGSFLHNCHPHPFFPVKDLVGGAATGDWLRFTAFERLLVVYNCEAGTEAEDPVITIEQAAANDGTGNVALDFTELQVKSGTLNAITGFTRVTQAADNTYTTVGEDESLILIEFSRADLAVGKSFVQVSVSDPGSTGAKLASCMGYFFDPVNTVADVASLPSLLT